MRRSNDRSEGLLKEGNNPNPASQDDLVPSDESDEPPPPLACGWHSMTRKKTLAAFVEEAARDAEMGGAKMTLFDLLCVGIGGTVGSGVFVLTGQVYPVAGPSASLSWMLAGCVCGLSALSYMELSARIPTKGSCYAFSFHAIGELPAVIGAVCLTLEYGLSGAGVARNWSAKLAALLRHFKLGRYMFFPYSSGLSVDDDGDDDFYVDVPAGILQVLCVVICAVGLKLGKVVINGFTVAKCALVTFMIVVGACAWRVNVFESEDVYFPQGFGGTISGTSLLFFGYIGFDEVCCLAGKAENPAQIMPRAIAGTLVGATVLSVLAQLALSGFAPYDKDQATSFEEGFDDIGWEWARYITAVGEVLLLPLVVLVSFLPQPELFAALAEDRVLPASFAVANDQGTLMHGTVVAGFVMTAFSVLVPFVVLWDMINVGVLLGFNLTNTSLLLVRYGRAGENNGSSAVGGAHSRYLGLEDNDVDEKEDHPGAAPSSSQTKLAGSSQQPSPLAAAVDGPTPDSTALAGKCVGSLWVCGIIGAYCGWLGLFQEALDGKPISNPAAAACGVIGLVCYAATVAVLYNCCTQHPPPAPHPRALSRASSSSSSPPSSPLEAPPPSIFLAPGVPFSPAAAMVFNFLLMAQYDALTHGYLLALIAIALCCYGAYKSL